MAVEVCAVWAPRQKSSFDYLQLLRCQFRSARKFGHRHLVITDGDLNGFNAQRVQLPTSLMKAMIAGVVERLKMGGKDHIVFLDIDCLVAKPLDGAFQHNQFDLGLTNRANDRAPINNGAMYVNAKGISMARDFFERALEMCGDDWGADQEAIAAAAAPVPHDHGIEDRNGMKLAFLSMREYNNAPKKPYAVPRSEPFVFHFKGEIKRDMPRYQRDFHLE